MFHAYIPKLNILECDNEAHSNLILNPSGGIQRSETMQVDGPPIQNVMSGSSSHIYREQRTVNDLG